MRWQFPSWLHSTTARFVVLIFVAQFTAMFSAAYFVRSASERSLLREQQAIVTELRDELISEYDSGGQKGLVNAINDRLQFSHGGIAVILLTRADGSVIAGNLEAWPPTLPRNTAWQVLTLYRPRSAQPEDIGFITSRLADGTNLLSGHVVDSAWQLRRANERALLAALIFALPISLLIALTLANLIDRRIAAVARTAEAVGFGDLAQRVETHGTNDAFDRLANNINAMLDRIQGLVSELRILTDSLAHDLRSPITRLNSVIERALMEAKDPVSISALESVSAEASALQAMLTTALQISRAEAGIGRDRFALTDIGALLSDLAEIYGPLAEDSGIKLVETIGSRAVTALVNRELLSQAVGNLIENAVKYAGGDRIELSAVRSGGSVAITVSDNGQGVRPDQRAVALKRFGRLDPARHLSGSGLGLSLVDAIAKLHGGRVELLDNDPGLRVRIEIDGAEH